MMYRPEVRPTLRDPLAEVTMLLAHGLLHLVGYDHETDEEEREMRAATNALVRAATAKSPSKIAISREAAFPGGSALFLACESRNHLLRPLPIRRENAEESLSLGSSSIAPATRGGDAFTNPRSARELTERRTET